jgi:dTDP-4-dehydrorhamnose reductase
MLVFGRSGQVARELARTAPPSTEVLCLGRDVADLATPGAGAAAVVAHAPDVVVNAAAWTAVDAAESMEAAAQRVNGRAPAELAAACAEVGVPFLHLSTDYVFDGSGEAGRTPEDPTGPVSAYGRSKLAGELGVLAAAPEAVVLRTAWVFSAHGANFVKTMVRLGDEHEVLSVVDDQIGGPTPAAAIAHALHRIAALRLAGEGAGGIHHFAGLPEVSWAEFAEAIFARTGQAVRVERIPTSAWPTPAARPANSRLDCSSTEAAFAVTRPDWRTGLDEVLTELRPGL